MLRRSDAYTALARRPRQTVAAVAMAALGVTVMVAISLVNHSTAGTIAERLNSLGSNTWTVSAPSGQAGQGSQPLPGASHRAVDLPGVRGAALIDVSTASIRSGPVAQPPPEQINLVGLEATGDLPALRLREGVWRLHPHIPSGVVGPRAAEALHLTTFPSVVFVGDQQLVITGVVVGDAVHAAFARGVLVDDRWLTDAGLGGSRSLLVMTSGADLSEQNLRAAANPVSPDGLSATLPIEIAAAQRAASASLGSGNIIVIACTYLSSAAGAALLFGSMLRSRVAEIGVRRCFGASGRQIALSLLTEAGLIGVAGTAVGFAVGLGAGGTWAATRNLAVTVGNEQLAAAATIGVVSALLAVGPTIVIASRMQPALAVGTAI